MGDTRASPERAAVVRGLLGTTGLDAPSMSVADLTPGLGQAFGVQEAARAGDVKGAIMAALPMPGGGAARELTAGAGAAERAVAGAGAREAETAVPGVAEKAIPLLKQEDPFGAHNPVGTHPHEEGLTVNDILHPDNPAINPDTGEPWQPRERGVEDIASELDLRAQNQLKLLGVKGGRITGPDPLHDELLARSLASEASSALDRPGANAADWYTGKVNEAMDVASKMYPEIATDPNAKMAFRAALAITSQGETVPANVRLATDAYEYFRENGQFPENIVAKQAPSMNGNFAKLNEHINANGVDTTREFLDSTTTPSQLKKDGFKVGSSELANEQVYGSHILGAKIGNGFYQNLGGNFDPVTMDLWWMRGWNCKTGNLVGAQDLTNQRARLVAELENEGQPVPKTVKGLDNVADTIASQHERDYTNFRPEYDAGTRVKSNLVKASERWQVGRSGINEQPSSGGDRQWMRSVVNRARAIMEDQGRSVTNADLQAILWYPEKDLYAKLGGRPSEGINVDYATALRDRARQKGLTDEQLQSPLLSAPGGPGSAPGANVAPGNAGGGPPVGGTRAPRARGTGAAGAPAAQAGPGSQVIPADGDPFASPPGLTVPVTPRRR